VEGHSGGILSIWNPLIDNLKPFSSHLGILLEGMIKGFDKMIIIINCYDPYSQRKEFWEIEWDFEGSLSYFWRRYKFDFSY